MSDQRVVALLGTGIVPADVPILRADDLGAIRGDGIFETMHVRSGQAWLLDRHLDRMASSAARMELDLPDRAALAGLVNEAIAAWPAEGEAAVRLICTRGPEAGPGPVTVFAVVVPIPESQIRPRHEGLSLATASLGFPADLRSAAPWLLGGAKTLSYAVNMASQRWAKSVGADDVLWISSDGYALEGPTSTLVWLAGGTLFTVPAEATGILAGTTARWLLDSAGELGWATAEHMIKPTELGGADSVWLTSSVRGPAPVRSLDGAELPFDERAARSVRELLASPDRPFGRVKWP